MGEGKDDEISNEDNDDRRASVGSSQNSGPSSPERIETERMSKDKADQKRENNRLYRQRKKSKMETLEAANEILEAETKDIMAAYGLVKGKNCQLKSQIKCLKQEMQLLNQRLETQSKELGGLRKTCDRLEEKNAEEHERNRRLKSKLKKREEKIESLEECKVNPTFESRSNEMPQQFVAPQVQSAQVAPETIHNWGKTLYHDCLKRKTMHWKTIHKCRLRKTIHQCRLHRETVLRDQRNKVNV